MKAKKAARAAKVARRKQQRELGNTEAATRRTAAPLCIAVVGATGAVGEVLFEILESRDLSVETVDNPDVFVQAIVMYSLVEAAGDADDHRQSRPLRRGERDVPAPGRAHRVRQLVLESAHLLEPYDLAAGA